MKTRLREETIDLTDRTDALLYAASKFAKRYGHRFVGPEDILMVMALSRTNGGAANTILRKLGGRAMPTKVIREYESIVGSKPKRSKR